MAMSGVCVAESAVGPCHLWRLRVHADAIPVDTVGVMGEPRLQPRRIVFGLVDARATTKHGAIGFAIASLLRESLSMSSSGSEVPR
ncbi:hypothetical protein GGR64_001106 [Xanthomonas arboricola]|nr:hypothetical protein [Xanthomonas sp. 3307]